VKPEHYRKLAAAGLDVDQIGIVMDIMAESEASLKAAEEARKSVARERVQRWREKNKADVTLQKRNGNATVRLTRAEDSSSKKQITEKEERKKDSAAAPRGDLDAFKGELSSILDTARVDAIVAVRRKKGATMTAHAGSLLVKALSACPDPCAAADEMVLRNWTGIKPEWLESRNSTAPPRTPPKGRDFNDILDELQGKNRNDVQSGPVFDASVNRADFGGAPGVVQLHALPARR